MAYTLAAAAIQNPAAPGSIEGVVLESGSGRPIAGADVVLNGATTTGVRTDAEGRFRLDGVQPGEYYFAVSKGGYVPFLRGSKRYAVRLEPGDRLTDFVIRLGGTGTLSGRVMDSQGLPVVLARVVVFRFVYSEWTRESSGVSALGSILTDDRGEFRFFDLPAGPYLLLYQSPDASAAPRAVLYPGVREIRAAEAVEVRVGQEERLRDIVLPPAMSGWIRARVVNATGRPLPRDLKIGMAPRGWSLGSGFGPATRTRADAAGIREFQPGLIGDYTLQAAYLADGENIAGYADVYYAGSDVEVDLTIERLQGRLSGRVLVETAEGALQPLSGVEMEFFNRMPEGGYTGIDGSFNISGLYPGPYVFSGAFDLPEGHYVAGVRSGERDVLREGVQVRASAAEIEVRVRADAGGLRGNVVDRNGRLVREAFVALVPQGTLLERTDRHNSYRWVRSAQSASWELSGIIPGDYLLYAWSGVFSESAVMDPWFMRRFEGRGAPVRVDGGSRVERDVVILDES